MSCGYGGAWFDNLPDILWSMLSFIPFVHCQAFRTLLCHAILPYISMLPGFGHTQLWSLSRTQATSLFRGPQRLALLRIPSHGANSRAMLFMFASNDLIWGGSYSNFRFSLTSTTALLMSICAWRFVSWKLGEYHENKGTKYSLFHPETVMIGANEMKPMLH